MSAKIIPFVLQTRRERRSDESSHVFRSRSQPDDLVMDHADTAPCEYSLPCALRLGEHEPA